jgi:hypothetical protein
VGRANQKSARQQPQANLGTLECLPSASSLAHIVHNPPPQFMLCPWPESSTARQLRLRREAQVESKCCHSADLSSSWIFPARINPADPTKPSRDPSSLFALWSPSQNNPSGSIARVMGTACRTRPKSPKTLNPATGCLQLQTARRQSSKRASGSAKRFLMFWGPHSHIRLRDRNRHTHSGMQIPCAAGASPRCCVFI